MDNPSKRTGFVRFVSPELEAKKEQAQAALQSAQHFIQPYIVVLSKRISKPYTPTGKQ